MEIHIHGHNMKVNPTLEDFTRKKLGRLDRYLPNIQDVRVELGREHVNRGDDRCIAQITIRHERGAILRAEERAAGDMEIAVNLALEKMYRQIERFKGKRDHKGREKFSATVEEIAAAEAMPDVEAQADDLPAGAIVRRKQVSITAMNEEEAIEQMELLGHTFFIFFDGTAGSLRVVYKRADDNYGVLNPIVE
ncbi:MAG: ribosome-associated translation inhibitor RaiA [Chloroflexota bacterium]|nr:ribosome-associated translation inhibitor RaiA [Chloroflexota bacterium]